MGDGTKPVLLRSLAAFVFAAGAVVALNLLVLALALYLIHGGASPAPPGPPAGVTVAPAGD